MSNQTAQAVENALKQEKTFQTVNFAITGDAETDMIAGILAVTDAAWRNQNQGPQYPGSPFQRMCQRICIYLASRYEAYALQAERQEDSFRHMSQAAQGQWRTSSGPNIGSGYGLGSAVGQVSPDPTVYQQPQQACNADPITLEQRQRILDQMLIHRKDTP